MKTGDFVIDKENEFNQPKFKFISGQKYNPELAKCEVVEIQPTAICVRINKHPLRIMKKDGGGISNPISSLEWFPTEKDPHRGGFDVIFSERFSVINNEF